MRQRQVLRDGHIPIARVHADPEHQLVTIGRAAHNVPTFQRQHHRLARYRGRQTRGHLGLILRQRQRQHILA